MRQGHLIHVSLFVGFVMKRCLRLIDLHDHIPGKEKGPDIKDKASK